MPSTKRSGQKGGKLAAKYCCRKATELDNVDKNISKCILDLMFISHCRGHTKSLLPASDCYNHYYYYNQAQGGSSSGAASVGMPAPPHAGSTSQASY